MLAFYVKTHNRIINACCILHNYVQGEMSEDGLSREVDHELRESLILEDGNDEEEQITTIRLPQEWADFRGTLVEQMFEEYQAGRARHV